MVHEESSKKIDLATMSPESLIFLVKHPEITLELGVIELDEFQDSCLTLVAASEEVFCG